MDSAGASVCLERGGVSASENTNADVDESLWLFDCGGICHHPGVEEGAYSTPPVSVEKPYRPVSFGHLAAELYEPTEVVFEHFLTLDTKRRPCGTGACIYSSPLG